MKAAVVENGRLVIRDVERPEPGIEEILIKIGAASLNRVDVITIARSATDQSLANTIPGREWAGEVVAIGANVQTDVRVGDRVMATGHSGYAEYAVADWGCVLPIPSTEMKFEKAAALPLGLMTMHDAIVSNGHLSKGQTVLITAASSGVGMIGIQLAKLMGAKSVIATTTRDERRAPLESAGADLVVNTRDANWESQVLDSTGNEGVDLVIDHVSGGVMNCNMRVTKVCGRIVNVGRLGGASETVDFDLHALKRITYVGVTFRTRSTEEVRRIVNRMREDLWRAVADGRISLPIDKAYRLEEAQAAAEHMQNDAHLGKIVLIP